MIPGWNYWAIKSLRRRDSLKRTPDSVACRIGTTTSRRRDASKHDFPSSSLLRSHLFSPSLSLLNNLIRMCSCWKPVNTKVLRVSSYIWGLPSCSVFQIYLWKLVLWSAYGSSFKFHIKWSLSARPQPSRLFEVTACNARGEPDSLWQKRIVHCSQCNPQWHKIQVISTTALLQ